jgi:2-haloacid dehalogenase
MTRTALTTFRILWAACAVVALAYRGDAAIAPARAAAAPRFKAVAFDYFVLFNPDSVLTAVEREFPARGREFTNLWRTRQFEYSWLRAITNRYEDFLAVTQDALVYAAGAMKLQLTADAKSRLLDAFLHLEPWPDTREALRSLKASGIRVITLANVSPKMLSDDAEHAGLTSFFDVLVSTDANHSYKPEPRAYALGMDRLHLAREDILFAAFGGWDAAGAKSFGYPTIWVNRFGQAPEELGIRPDRTQADLAGLLEFVLGGSPTQ